MRRVYPESSAGKRREISRKAGHARAAKLTPEERTAIARKGGLARWAKVRRSEAA
jgi:general stress protein YciG